MPETRKRSRQGHEQDTKELTLQLGQLLGGHNNGHQLIGASGSYQVGIGNGAHVALAHLQVLHPDIQSLLGGFHGTEILILATGVANIEVDMCIVDENLTGQVKVAVGDIDVRLDGLLLLK